MQLGFDFIVSHREAFLTTSRSLVPIGQELIELSLFRSPDVLVFQVDSVLGSEAFPFIDDCKETGHGQLDFFEVVPAKVDLAELLAHEEVRLELVLLFQKDVPEFVQVVVVFESELFSAPRPSILHVLSRINVHARPRVQILRACCLRVKTQFLHTATGRLDRLGSLLEVVPINAHLRLKLYNLL